MYYSKEFFALTAASDMKVAMYLTKIAHESTGEVILDKAERAALCEMAHVNPTQLSRTLKSLKNKGLIDIKNSRIHCKDLEILPFFDR